MRRNFDYLRLTKISENLRNEVPLKLIHPYLLIKNTFLDRVCSNGRYQTSGIGASGEIEPR